MTQAAQQPVVQIKAALANAERDLEAAQIATSKEQLLTVRVEGRRVKAELDKLVRQIHKLDAAIALARGDLAALADAINAHHVGKPDPADFPSDEELAAWQAELARLESAQLEQSRLITDLMHQRAYPVQRAVDLDAAFNRLRHHQQNLERVVRGETLGFEGSINAV